MREQQDDTQIQQAEQGTPRPLPALAPSREVATIPEQGIAPVSAKLKYGTAAFFTTGATTAVLGAGPFGVVIGGVAFWLAWSYSDEIHRAVVTRFPTRARPATHSVHHGTRVNNLQWWLTGRVATPADVQEEEESVDDTPLQGEEPEQTTALVTGETYHPQKHRDALYIGHTLYPHADTFLSGRTTIFGVSGSGKSNTMGVVMEELGRLGVPFVCCDTEGEYEPLCTKEYLKRPYLATAWNLTIETAPAFGRQVLDKGLQVILSLDTFETDNIAAEIMIALISGMREWQEELPNNERVACAVILDEAQVWLPENEAESYVSRVKDPNTKVSLLNRLQQTFFNVVRRGRKRGIGFIFATQKLAEIDNRCLQADWGIYHRQEDIASLKRYAELGMDKDIAMALADGEAWIKSKKAGLNRNYQIRKRNSPHGAHTPGLDSVRARYRTSPLQGGVVQGSVVESRKSPDTGPLVSVPERSHTLKQGDARTGTGNGNATGSQQTYEEPPVKPVPTPGTGTGTGPESRERSEERGFMPGPHDRTLPPEKVRMLIRLAQKQPGLNIKEYLRALSVGNGYAKHAGYILKNQSQK